MTFERSRSTNDENRTVPRPRSDSAIRLP